jgi:hypothetical protein
MAVAHRLEAASGKRRHSPENSTPEVVVPMD